MIKKYMKLKVNKTLPSTHVDLRFLMKNQLMA